jgi:hypothetical protein
MILSAVVGLLTACEAVTFLRPPEPAVWRLPNGQVVNEDTREFVALVLEVSCASGRSSEGRIVGPEIEYTDETVTVTFGVRPLKGFRTCQGNPETPIRVTLAEPVGDRRLRDGHEDLPICAGKPCPPLDPHFAE